MNVDFIVYSGDLTAKISKIAFLNGSGGNSVEKIIKNNDIHCIVTGDVGYHHVKIAQLYGIPIIDAGHFGTEKILLNYLKKQKLILKNLKQKLKIYQN